MIETKRLLLEPFQEDDLPVLCRLRADPEVARYMGGDEYCRPEKVAERFRFYLDHQRKHGFACSRVILKETGEIIGWGGLGYLDDSEDIEIGYGFAKLYWGQGLATETAEAWLRYGFETLGLERIVAIALPDNEGSWRVMEKLGMEYQGMRDSRSFHCVCYAITREQFAARQKSSTESRA